MRSSPRPVWQAPPVRSEGPLGVGGSPPAQRTQWSLSQVEPPPSSRSKGHFLPRDEVRRGAVRSRGPKGTVRWKETCIDAPTLPTDPKEAGREGVERAVVPTACSRGVSGAPPTSFHHAGPKPRLGRNEGGQRRRGWGSREQTATYPDYSQRSGPTTITLSCIAKCVSASALQRWP